MSENQRLTRLLCVLAFLCLGKGAWADPANYSGGSIYDLDPPANQATGNRILEQLVQNNDMQAVQDLSPNDMLRQLARPVGRLAMEHRDGKLGYCTASMITDDLLITANHCIPGKGAVKAAMLWMGYITPRSRKGVAQYPVDLNPVETSRRHDYSILRVGGSPGREWGTISLSADPLYARQSLFIVHHPGGFAQQISLGHCRTHDPAIQENDILHVCDTLGGSSGAPIFDNNSRTVVGLHYSAVALEGLNAGKWIAGIVEQSDLVRGLIRNASVSPGSTPSGPSPPPAAVLPNNEDVPSTSPRTVKRTPARRLEYCYVDDVRPPDAWLALRSVPSTRRGRQLARLGPGTRFVMTGERQGYWYQVETEIRDIGWVSWQKQRWITCTVE